jgi:hypothetical protein
VSIQFKNKDCSISDLLKVLKNEQLIL